MNKDLYPHFSLSKGVLSKFGFKVTNEKQLFDLINKSILKKSACTDQDKLEVLELRDHVLKLVRNEILEQSKYSTMSACELARIRWTVCSSAACTDMCPEKERLSRITLKQVSPFECTPNNGGSSGKPDHSLIIKKYARSSADQDLPLPNELRPLSVLHQTMMYLINEVMPQIERINSAESAPVTSFSVAKWYDFIWNRSRAIRKDIVQQRLLFGCENPFSNGSKYSSQSSCSSQSSSSSSLIINGAELIEQCARFHIMCAYRLSSHPPDVFDFHINEETLKNCFQSLKQFYDSRINNNNENDQYNNSNNNNEAEFRAYMILLNLKETNILNEIQRWQPHVRHSAPVRFALNVYFAYTSNNYAKFFDLVRSKSSPCSYLQACILHRYFDGMRQRAVRVMSSSYRDVYRGKSERLLGLSKLSDLLGFDDSQECRVFCRRLGHSVRDDDQHEFVVLDSSATTNSSANDLNWTATSCRLVDSKFDEMMKEGGADYEEGSVGLTREECLSQVISGQSVLPQIKQEQIYLSHSSFNPEGVYVEKDIQEFFDLAELICSSRDPGLPPPPPSPQTTSYSYSLPVKTVTSPNNNQPSEIITTTTTTTTIATKKTGSRRIEYCEDWIEISSSTSQAVEEVTSSMSVVTNGARKRSRSRSVTGVGGDVDVAMMAKTRKVSRCEEKKEEEELVVSDNDFSRTILNKVAAIEGFEKNFDSLPVDVVQSFVRPLARHRPLTNPVLLLKADLLNAQFLKQQQQQ